VASDRLRFGKFSGHRVADVPSAYLVWLIEHGIEEQYWTSIRQELAERLSLTLEPAREILRPPPHLAPTFRELLVLGYKQLAKTAHPDHGGDVAHMQAVNAVRAWAREAGLV
jgi:uncharacterized protein (DUF3820 family)